MSDQPVREPIEPDPLRDRTDAGSGADLVEEENAPIRPSAAEGNEEDGGRRSSRPSQAEGERV